MANRRAARIRALALAAVALIPLEALTAGAPFPDIDPDDPWLVRAPKYSGFAPGDLEAHRWALGIPDAEREMSYEALVAALVAGEGWARGALDIRLDGAGPVEYEQVARAMAKAAATIDDPARARDFAATAARVLPGPLMLPVVEAALFDGTPEYLDMMQFVRIVSSQRHPLPEALPRLRELYGPARNDRDILLYERKHHFPRLHHHIVAAMGACGEAGIDAILETGIRARSSAEALGHIGTDRAYDLLMQWHHEVEAESIKMDCLAALCKKPFDETPPRVRAFVREHLTRYFSHPDVKVRQPAAEIAGYSGDLHFLPFLVEMYTNEEDAHAKYLAEQAISAFWGNHFKGADARIAHTRYAIESRKGKIAYYEQALADPKYEDSHRAAFADEIEKAKAELPLLEVQLAALEAQKAQFFAGELMPEQ